MRTYKTTLLLLLFMLFGGTAMAQETRFGFRAGVNLANVNEEGAPQGFYKMIADYHGGGFVNIGFNKFFSVEPGLQLSMKGAWYNQEVQGVTVKTTERLMYLDIPLLLRVAPIPAFDIFAGPQASIFLKQFTDFEFMDQKHTESNRQDIKTLDVGMVMGGTFYLKDRYHIQASYELGMSPIVEGDAASVQTRVIKISLGYTF